MVSASIRLYGFRFLMGVRIPSLVKGMKGMEPSSLNLNYSTQQERRNPSPLGSMPL